MKLLCLFLFSALLSINILSQEFVISQYRGELNIKLDVIDEKRLEKGLEILNEANQLEIEAVMMLETMSDSEKIEGVSPAYKKMIKKFLDASETYGEGHEIIYYVFEDNCDEFQVEMKKMNHYASGMNKAKYYENKGESSYERSMNIREMLIDADKPEWIQYKMHEALELEKLAIRDKGRALQIYQDFPVEYNYNWEDDVTADELKKFFKNPVVKLPPEDVFKKKPKEEQQKPEGGYIEYRVQIAAHTAPIDQEQIKYFYTGKDSVMEVREGNWFKYQIGKFDTFEEANELRARSRVPRAFVVAYQDDKKLTIKQALAIQQKNQ